MIREILQNDIPACIPVIRNSFLTVAEQFGLTPENAPAFTAFSVNEAKLLFWMQEQHRPMYGYFKDGKPVGYYNLLIQDDTSCALCELGSLCVLPDERHHGIGDLLLRDAITNAQKRGCRIMKLSIVAENTVLRQWYEQHGFVYTDTKKFDFFPFTCGYMEKRI